MREFSAHDRCVLWYKGESPEEEQQVLLRVIFFVKLQTCGLQ